LTKQEKAELLEQFNEQTFSVLSCMMLGRNWRSLWRRPISPSTFLSVPLCYLARFVTPNQTRSASLYPAAASNWCMSRQSKLLRNWTKPEKTGRN